MLNRRTPLKAKPKRKSAVMKRYHHDVAAKGCLVCGGPATVHHVTSTRFGPVPLSVGPRRDDARVAPLCAMHHQKAFDPKASDPQSVEGLNHQQFYEVHGIDLFKWANDNWSAWERENGK